MKKLAIVGASAALAAMPIVGVFAATESDYVTDNIQVTVKDSCNLEVETGEGKNIEEEMTVGTVNTNIEGSSFSIACNTEGEWSLSAEGAGDSVATALNGQGEGGNIASSTDPKTNLIVNTTTSDWGFKLEKTGDANLESGYDAWHQIPTGTTKVAGGTAVDKTDTIKVTYGVAISDTQKADTYKGAVKYTLSQP